MMLEVTAFPKPGNVDRCHDYASTRLEHFLASAILARKALEQAEESTGGLGSLIRGAVQATSSHGGGNTHFGAFLLLIPLVAGGDIPAARALIRSTTVEDAVAFYQAFALTRVRMLDHDPLDVNNPEAIRILRERGLTLHDVMAHSAPNDLVAREWVEGFPLTRRAADLLHAHGCGRGSIVAAFLDLLATVPDTFIAKKHGVAVAEETMHRAAEVRAGTRNLEEFDRQCIERGINPGSLADVIVAGIYVALGEGWQWEC
jgi:triphosphoribosyl-dephospho-CoA synthase